MIEYLIEGPLWYFSLAVFCIGVLWQLARIIFAAGKTDLSVARGSASGGALRNVFSRFVPHREIAPRIRLQVIAGYMFHLGLFALLFFAAPHVHFLEETPARLRLDADAALGLSSSPPSSPFFGLILLWLRRMLNSVSRLISTTDDHIAAILTFVVMLTGCLALGQGFHALNLLHLLHR